MNTNINDLNKYKKKLIKERDLLIKQLNVDKLQIKNFPKSEVGDIVDKAYSVYEKSKTMEMLVNEKKMLQVIEQALIRIEKHTYGICICCGDSINEKRLNAIPWVNTCMRKNCTDKRK
jgi:DnaK suppressor protein